MSCYRRIVDLNVVHFDDSQFELKRQDGWKRLKLNAVPTLIPKPIRVIKMAKIMAEPSPVTEVVDVKKSRCKRKSSVDNAELACKKIKKTLESRINKEVEERLKDGSWNRGKYGDLTRITYLESENQLLLKNIEKFQNTLLKAKEKLPKKGKVNGMTINVENTREKVFSEIVPHNNNTTEKQPIQRKRSPRIMLQKCKTEKEDSQYESSITLSEKGKNGPKSSATLLKPSDSEQLAALLKQWNEILKLNLQEIEGKYRNETMKNQILLECVVELENENKLLKDKNKSLEQDIMVFEKSNKDMITVISELEKHNKTFANKVEKLNNLKSLPVIELQEKIKGLEIEKKIMIEENESMLKEVKDFMTNNQRLSEIICDLEKNNEVLNFKVQRVGGINRTMGEQIRELMQHIECMNEKLSDVRNHRTLSQDQLLEKEAENENITVKCQYLKAENEAKTAKIAELEEEIAILRTVEIENNANTEKIIKLEKLVASCNSRCLDISPDGKKSVKKFAGKLEDLNKIVEGIVHNEPSSNMHIKITKMKDPKTSKPNS